MSEGCRASLELNSGTGAPIFRLMSVQRDLRRRLRRDEPCLPRLTKEPPSGPDRIYEIKHDGFRLLAHLYGPAARCKPKMSLEKVGLALLYPAY